MARMKKLAAKKKAPAARGKAAKAKTPPAKAKAKRPVKPAPAAKGTARPASKPSPKTASARRPAARPKAKARRRRTATPVRVHEMSWGAMVDSLNARVAARGMPLWDVLAHSMAATRVLPPPLPRAVNVQASAPDGVRAFQFLSMARACVADLHGERPLAARENMARFLLHTAWHGSKLRFRRQGRDDMSDGDGPGRGLVPFEAHRAKDTLIRLARASSDRVAHRLGDIAGLGWPGLVRAAHSLPDWGHGGRGSTFPDGHIVEGLLERNDQFALYLARAAFLLIPPAVPIGNTNHAEYWYAFWRCSAPDPDAERLAFRIDADAVDALIDG